MARKSKRTLRNMGSVAREIAKVGAEAGSLSRRLINLSEKVDSLEKDLSAFKKWQERLPVISEQIKY